MELRYIFNLFFCAYIVSAAHLPSNLNVCKISGPDFDKCLQESLQDALPKLANGIPELDVPNVDPFTYVTLTIKRVPGPISLDQEYTNTKLHGISKSKVNQFNVDVKNGCKLAIDALVPELRVTGHYVLKGQMLMFPIDAEGDLVIKFDNARFVNKMDCEKYNRDGAEYIKVTSSKIDFNSEKVAFDLGKIIQGNDQIDRDIHKIIDDDPMAFFEIMRPTAVTMMETLYVEVCNRLFYQVPVNELFND